MAHEVKKNKNKNISMEESYLLSCASFLINTLRDGLPGTASHHASKEAIQLPNTQLAAILLNGFKVSIQDTKPEFAVGEAEVTCQVLERETWQWWVRQSKSWMMTAYTIVNACMLARTFYDLRNR